MKSIEDLKKIREDMRQRMSVRNEDDSEDTRITIGMATCGIAAGARDTLAAVMDEIDRRGLHHAVVTQTGCVGICRFEPIVEVKMPGQKPVTYIKVNADKARQIVLEHVVNNHIIEEYTIGAAE